MNVVLIGGSAGTCERIRSRLLDGGHRVTAFVDDPTPLPDHDNLQAIRGAVRDTSLVRAAIRSHDSVVCALGVDGADDSESVEGDDGVDGDNVFDGGAFAVDAHAVGVANVLDGMRAVDVDRLVCVSERNDLDDPAYAPLTESDVAWTLVRRATRPSQSTTERDHDDTWTGDVASLVVDALEHGRFVGKQVAVDVAE